MAHKCSVKKLTAKHQCRSLFLISSGPIAFRFVKKKVFGTGGNSQQLLVVNYLVGHIQRANSTLK